MARIVTVSHALGSYPVSVAPRLLEEIAPLASKHLADRRTAMIADATVYSLYTAGRLGAITWTGETLCVPPGETSKTRETWARLTDELLERRFGRHSGLIGFGGGVVGDLTGFVAATFMRGLPYVLVPTTLLAMLDASVGGKTAVNAPQGKNLIGAFHPPVAVMVDPLTLTTLPEREYRSGLAEAVKHGLIADADYFHWIEAESESILRRDLDTLARLVYRSVQIKADVVSGDEREAGRRAVLNAGHTVAHALEQLSGFRLSHGEAVALGMIVECAVAERLGVAQPGVRARVAALLEGLGLPVKYGQSLDIKSAVAQMGTDKKNRGGMIHCALPAAIGRMHYESGWTLPVPAGDLETALEELQ
jgi:3-dehydroquinate synthase